MKENTNWMNVIKINLLLMLLIVIAVELIFGGWIFHSNKSYCGYLLCSANVKYQKLGYQTNYTKDSFGLRNRRGLDEDIDILTVGGSTTDQRWLDDKETWTYLLEKKFKENNKDISIVSAGIDGQSTFGHIWNFKEWFPEIPNFHPRYVLFYIGINDIPPQDNASSFDNVDNIYNWRYLVKMNSIFYRLYYWNKYQTKNLLADKAKLNHGSNSIYGEYIEKFDIAKNDWKIYKEKVVDNKLIKNLDELVRLTKKLGSEPIFVTQKTARWITKDGLIIGSKAGKSGDAKYSYKGGTYYFNNSDWGYAEKIVSDSIINYCNSNNIYCIDGFNKIEIHDDDTYDLVHMNFQGSSEIAKKLYLDLKNYIQP